MRKMEVEAPVAENLDLVLKLKKTLSDAISGASVQKEENIIRILKRLSVLPMSIDILKVTEIGKQVNSLRKWGGKVSSRAKSLVKKWKQLLPVTEQTPQTDCHSLQSTGSVGLELRQGSNDNLTTLGKLTEEKWHRDSVGVSLEVPFVQIASADSEDSVVDLTEQPETQSKKSCRGRKNHHGEKGKKKMKTAHREESFSEALEMPFVSNKVSGSRSSSHMKRTGDGGRKSHPSKDESLDDVVIVRAELSKEFDMAKIVGKERSPVATASSLLQRDNVVAGARHKGAQQEVVIGQSRRSRTQVYSGRAQIGPQVVTSLFDMCMKILIDNIDVIEEVGAGVPYHVLEPLLQRCTAPQLMKLEDYNPHLVEDTEELWRKHVAKDFKVTKMPLGDSWRDLYREKLAEREEKLRKLTARIKANSHAREEPVRKVMLAAATMKPGRRSGLRRGGGGGFSQPLERPHPGNKLMKRTMKMAKERNHIMTFKQGRGRAK